MPPTGETGVGKTAIIKHLLNRLKTDRSDVYKSNSILGQIFNFTDKNQALLDNISSLGNNLTSERDGE